MRTEGRCLSVGSLGCHDNWTELSVRKLQSPRSGECYPYSWVLVSLWPLQILQGLASGQLQLLVQCMVLTADKCYICWHLVFNCGLWPSCFSLCRCCGKNVIHNTASSMPLSIWSITLWKISGDTKKQSQTPESSNWCVRKL